MSIIAIKQQPVEGGLLAAYRPIVFIVDATGAGGVIQPPFVVCDIYVKEKYYRSILRTVPDSVAAAATYSFDVSEALQEVLQVDIADVGNSLLLTAPNMSALVFCRFRSSSVDQDGFTVEDGPKPVQATKGVEAVAGGGMQSNSFFVINAALQHDDHQDLRNHLEAYKLGAWNDKAYPMTHRPRSFFLPGSADHFPFIYAGDCLDVDIVLHYRNRFSNEWITVTGADNNTCEAVDYSLELVGNTVRITMNALTATQVRYKKSTDSVWTVQGTYNTKDIQFSINDEGIYNIQVITFCSCCSSSAPIEKTVMINDTISSLRWRGTGASCQVTNFDQPVFVKLEYRNVSVQTTNYPNDVLPIRKTEKSFAELWALFFSDEAMINPLHVTKENLNLFIKMTKGINNLLVQATQETLESYTLDVDATEVHVTNLTAVTKVTNLIGSSLNDSQEIIVPYLYPENPLRGGNNGLLQYATLEQYNIDTGVATGNTKPNTVGDPDYVAPVEDAATCPTTPPVVTVMIDQKLSIYKFEIWKGDYQKFWYVPTNGDTHSGNYIYIFPVPKDVLTDIVVRIGTLDTTNTSGNAQVRIIFEDGHGETYGVQLNREMSLNHATFKNMKTITISNF